ncbi:hypothetical protein [Paenibacillus aestuarii]|uniref:Uncharacterized protein n=1 Tax=Paenibacillus aestuarii TaxID=516965 RepID=A0ABW0K9W8_9BACL|nr:hypothetical protein [Paenibacillus aestuarii]
MKPSFIEELHKLKHQDEMRPKVLIRGIKRILEEKKKVNRLTRFLKRKPKTKPTSWQ